MKKLKTKIKIIVRIPINADALSTWVRGAVTSSRVISPMMVHPNSLSLRADHSQDLLCGVVFLLVHGYYENFLGAFA
ncbi:hypothetical protein [Anaerobiospirillum succiniciproducens]|uniref:hypothetical protein n=1 Tax=Anaerobiospirillum succiniciproducens TaxID=13335 RepID=UPI003F88FB91